jgi:predicted transcriptional regulator
MSSKNRVTVNLSDNEAAQLSLLAREARVSKAWLGRRAICDLLDRAQNGDQEATIPIVAARKGKP